MAQEKNLSGGGGRGGGGGRTLYQDNCGLQLISGGSPEGAVIKCSRSSSECWENQGVCFIHTHTHIYTQLEVNKTTKV